LAHFSSPNSIWISSLKVLTIIIIVVVVVMAKEEKKHCYHHCQFDDDDHHHHLRNRVHLIIMRKLIDMVEYIFS